MAHLFLLSGDRSVTVVVCTVLVIVIGILYPWWRRHTKIRALKQRHGCKDPFKYPHEDRIWGSDMVRLRTEAMKEGRFLKLYEEQFELCGKTFEEIWRGKRLINTIEPENVQTVAALAFEDYAKDPERLQAQSPFMGPSIFSDGSIWKQARAIVKPIFSRAELSDIDHFASFADRFMELLPDDGNMVDIQPLLNRLFLDVSMDFLFGRSLNSLQFEIPTECTEFVQAFDQAQKGVTQRREAGWIQSRRHRYNESKEWKDAYTKVHRYVDEQVAHALRRLRKENPLRTAQIRDPIALRYHILGVFNPARESTSVAVGNSIFQLARHPDIWAKLRRKSLELGDTPLTFEKLKSLLEFRYVVQETIRVVGPAARVWRMAVRNTILPVGGGPDQKSPVFVARGTPVVLGTWAMNHDRDIWGDDIDVFRPDRWIGRKPLWQFVPFFGGARMCPAQQQIYTHTVYLLVRLTQRFERIENCDPVFEYLQQFKLSFHSRNGVKVAFKG